MAKTNPQKVLEFVRSFTDAQKKAFSATLIVVAALFLFSGWSASVSRRVADLSGNRDAETVLPPQSSSVSSVPGPAGAVWEIARSGEKLFAQIVPEIPEFPRPRNLNEKIFAAPEKVFAAASAASEKFWKYLYNAAKSLVW